MPNEDSSKEFVTALARGLDVLQAFSREEPELTLTEVARKTGLNAAAARRSLRTLHTLGYIAINGRRFLLTPRVLKLSTPFFSSMNLQEVAQQYLQDIVAKTGDSSSVTILDGNEVVYIATSSVKRPSRVSTTLGTRFPAHVTALGRVLLAHLDPPILEQRLAEMAFRQYTENSVRNATAMRVSKMNGTTESLPLRCRSKSTTAAWSRRSIVRLRHRVFIWLP
jgi:IclR family pca regulon transcriptional regulator